MQLRANRMLPKVKQMAIFLAFEVNLGIPALTPIGLSLYIAAKGGAVEDIVIV